MENKLSFRAQRTVFFLFAAIFSSTSFAQRGCPNINDILITNGAIHTMDAQSMVVESVRILGNRVAATGSGRLGATRCTNVIDLEGRTAIPGIIDNHNHIVLLGLRPGHDTRLESANSISAVLRILTAKAAGLPDGEWITSIGGFDLSQFVAPPDEPRFPSFAELDAAVPDHPCLPAVVICRACRDKFTCAGILRSPWNPGWRRRRSCWRLSIAKCDNTGITCVA